MPKKSEQIEKPHLFIVVENDHNRLAEEGGLIHVR